MNLLELRKWLAELNKHVEQTNASYPKNLVKGWPIPFFGEILSASILTVGVNPSDKEFAAGRRWNQTTNAEGWEKRLLGYFQINDIPPASWFETWTICLDILGRSYQEGKGAHADISPRATSAMLSQRTDAAEFRRMVEHDVQWFFQLVAGSPNIQLLLVAGPIPRANRSKQQLGNFIREQAPKHGVQWIQNTPFPQLVFPDRPEGVTVCVCPFEPSMDGLYAMVRHIHRHRDTLRRLATHKLERIPVIPKAHDWQSLVGNFLMNFAQLDHTIYVFLEKHLSDDEFEQVKEWHLKDRLDRAAQKLKEAGKSKRLQTEFAELVARLAPIRELRNHVAHGHFYFEFAKAPAAPAIVIVQPKEIFKAPTSEIRRLSFRELLEASNTLNALSDDFARLAGFKEPWRGTPDEFMNQFKTTAR